MELRDHLSLLIEDYISKLELAAEPALLYEPIRYSMQHGGKRVRPLLLLMSCNVFSDDLATALPAAAAAEVFHNFTLLHDDIMDNAPLRRGKPSVYAKWDTNVAILSGDAMVVYGYKLLEKLPDSLFPRVVGEYSKMAGQVFDGQRYDMDFEERDNVQIEEYMDMIRLKTSVLLAGSCKIGAIIGGASSLDCDTIYQFALQLGLAYQIQDDLLDSYGTTAELGKNMGGDILEGKKTMLMINAIRLSSPQERAELNKLLADKEVSPNMKIEIVRAIYDRFGLRQLLEQQIVHHTTLALDALEKLSVDPAQTMPLRELTHSLISRNR